MIALPRAVICSACRRAAAAAALILLASIASAQATTFTYTGGEQAYVVPSGVTEVAIQAIGAPGGIGCLGTTGGAGAEITADFAVGPGLGAVCRGWRSRHRWVHRWILHQRDVGRRI